MFCIFLKIIIYVFIFFIHLKKSSIIQLHLHYLYSYAFHIFIILHFPFFISNSFLFCTQGALITIIHIKDGNCQVPTCILHQYLKQYSGQLTKLKVSHRGTSRDTRRLQSDEINGMRRVRKIIIEGGERRGKPKKIG